MRVPQELEGNVGNGNPEWERILIVDDDQNINNLLKRFLVKRMPEHTIFQAFDGFEAGRLISEWRPGVILLDINLPGIDGHKLCQKIKHDPALGNPVVIAITGLTDDGLEQTIMQEGADAFYAKPLDFESLRSKILQLITLHRGGGNGA
jgi:two-component system OmpR family response regulator